MKPVKNEKKSRLNASRAARNSFAGLMFITSVLYPCLLFLGTTDILEWHKQVISRKHVIYIRNIFKITK